MVAVTNAPAYPTLAEERAPAGVRVGVSGAGSSWVALPELPDGGRCVGAHTGTGLCGLKPCHCRAVWQRWLAASERLPLVGPGIGFAFVWAWCYPPAIGIEK